MRPLPSLLCMHTLKCLISLLGSFASSITSRFVVGLIGQISPCIVWPLQSQVTTTFQI